MPDLIGSTLGHYQILEQIGLGGMATVYKAYQPGMNRLVALKVLPEHYARDPRFVKRFELEAQVVAKLEHRNIVPIYDYGVHENTAYLTMRYLQAGTVKDILARGALPLADAAHLLNDIAAALDYAHSQGIIHRDVKPANVLVDKQGNAYLTDFGIAKVLEGTQELTGSGMLGTPAYMAPEQTLGKPVTPQSDLYALGVMLYEMVTDRPPYEADTPMAVALMHVYEPLPLPRKLKPDLPEAMELVLLKALAKEPADRFRSADELARAFAAAIGTEQSDTSSRLIELASGVAEGKGSEEVTYHVREELKKRKSTERGKQFWRAVPIGAVLLVLVAVVGLVLWLALEGQRKDTAAQQTAIVMVGVVQTATWVAGLPTETLQPTATPGPTATLDLPAAATQLQAQTQAQAAAETAAQAVVLTNAQATRSMEETIIALTPSKTPTKTPMPLPTPTSALARSVIRIAYDTIAQGGCAPTSASAGLIIFNQGIGTEGGPEAIKQLIGDSFATFTVNGEVVPPASSWGGIPLNEHGRTIEPSCGTSGHCGFETAAAIVLVPGVYEVRATWQTANYNQVLGCQLTIK